MARADRQGRADDDWLFANQTTLTPAVRAGGGQAIGGITDFNGGYAQALQEVKADASLGGQLGVSSTPTFFINGRKCRPGVIPAALLDALIELELKRAK